MKLSIRARLSFSFAFIFTALIIVFSSVIYFLMSSDLEQKLREDTLHDLNEVLLVFESGDWADQLAEMSEESREFMLSIKVVDPQGEILFLTEGVNKWDWPVEKDALTRASVAPFWSDEEINNVSHLVWTQSFVPKDKPPHFLQIANSRSGINHIRNELIFCFNIGTLVILLVAIAAGQYFAKRALAPVERIRARAQSIKTDNLHERLVYDGPPDELSRLTDTLNDLLGRIQESMTQMKLFIADASHELRIPLAGLRGTLEVGLRQNRTSEECREIMDTAYRESERMSELVADLLSLARADAGEINLEKTEVQLEDFLKNVFVEAEALNAEKKVNIRLGNVTNGKAVFDEARIHQLLVNLIDNAIRYNKPGGEVVLSAAATNGQLRISVKDTGIGIGPEDISKIFDRFYRVDKARSREAGGTGLGLAIASAIAHAHNGDLTVQSVIHEGSEFILTMPLS